MKTKLFSVCALVCILFAMSLFGASAFAASSSQGSSQESSGAATQGTTGVEVEADGLFVDAQWLSDHRDEVVIVDARSSADYATQHIPGAVNIHWATVSNLAVAQGEEGWGEASEGRALATLMSVAGIDGTKPIVVYTDPLDGWGEDGRILWMLKRAGASDVYLLNGGWHQWLYQIREHQRGLTGKDVSGIEQVNTDYVKKQLGKAKIVDSRTPEEYAGEITMGEKREGRIPGAVSIPFVSIINEDGTTLSSEELTKVFKDAGLSTSDEIIVYCTGGVRGAYMAEMLASNGFENVKLYTAGYSEWAGNGANKVEQ